MILTVLRIFQHFKDFKILKAAFEELKGSEILKILRVFSISTP